MERSEAYTNVNLYSPYAYHTSRQGIGGGVLSGGPGGHIEHYQAARAMWMQRGGGGGQYDRGGIVILSNNMPQMKRCGSWETRGGGSHTQLEQATMRCRVDLCALVGSPPTRRPSSGGADLRSGRHRWSPLRRGGTGSTPMLRQRQPAGYT
jgi:hypothetical protein